MERAKPSALRTAKKLLGFLGRRQKAEFCGVLVILVVSAALTQLTPLAVAGIVVLVVPLGILIVLRQIATQKGIRVELMETRAAMDGTMAELLGGIETIRVLNSAHTEAERIGARSEQLRRREMRHHRAMAFYDCLKFINEAVFHVLVIGLTILLAGRGIISVGTVLAAYLCFNQLTSPLRELHRILDEFSESLVLADDYFAIAELTPDFSCAAPDGPAPDRAAGELALEDVCFAYPEKPDQPVLRHISLTVEPGRFVGVAGPSGCGKSSLIKLIAKLEPCQGRIRLGGDDLAGLSRAQIARRIALVPQTPFLIADTVYNSIVYGLDRAVSPGEVAEAARMACLDGLDNTTEKLIQKQIEQFQARYGITVLSIAHRLSTLENCDEILVMDKGRIVQRGDFAALQSQPGIFRDMHRGILK